METTSSSSRVCVSDADDALDLDGVVRHLLELDDEPARRRFVERCLALFPADELLPFLKDESERYQNVDPYSSLRLAETLVGAGDVAGRPDHRALVLMAKGDALRCLGRYGESVATLDKAEVGLSLSRG